MLLREEMLMKDIILYHGSRWGLEGDIAPSSRAKTDFGKGFYLGTNDYQAKGIISNESDGVFYTVKLRLSEIPENKILVLSGQDWLYTILANRKKCKEFSQLSIAQDYLDLVNNYDVIVGPIADDRMNTCFKRFIENALTDEGLEACLKSVDYGKQYVLKTPFACSKVDMISAYEMTEEEKHSIQTHNYNLQLDGDKVVRNAVIAYRNQGLYLDQIIAKEQELQNNREIDDYERE